MFLLRIILNAWLIVLALVFPRAKRLSKTGLLSIGYFWTVPNRSTLSDKPVRTNYRKCLGAPQQCRLTNMHCILSSNCLYAYLFSDCLFPVILKCQRLFWSPLPYGLTVFYLSGLIDNWEAFCQVCGLGFQPPTCPLSAYQRMTLYVNSVFEIPPKPFQISLRSTKLPTCISNLCSYSCPSRVSIFTPHYTTISRRQHCSAIFCVSP